MQILPTNLKTLRIIKKLTQKQVAEHVKKSRSTINMYERGEREPDLTTLSKMCELYDNTDLYSIINTPLKTG